MAAHIGIRANTGAAPKSYVRTAREAARLLARLKQDGIPLPDELREWRRERGLSMRAIAEIEGIHPRSWARREGSPRTGWWKPAPAYLPLFLEGYDIVKRGDARPRKTSVYALKLWRSRFRLGRRDASVLVRHAPGRWGGGSGKRNEGWENASPIPAYLAYVLVGAEAEMRRQGIVPGMLTVRQVGRALGGISRQAVCQLIEGEGARKLAGAVQLPSGRWLVPKEAVDALKAATS